MISLRRSAFRKDSSDEVRVRQNPREAGTSGYSGGVIPGKDQISVRIYEEVIVKKSNCVLPGKDQFSVRIYEEEIVRKSNSVIK